MVRMQLNQILVLHCDPGKISSNGRITEKQSSYPYGRQETTDPFCYVSFDPGRLEDHLTCLVFQIQSRWTTEPLIEHMTTSSIEYKIEAGKVRRLKTHTNVNTYLLNFITLQWSCPIDWFLIAWFICPIAMIAKNL